MPKNIKTFWTFYNYFTELAEFKLYHYNTINYLELTNQENIC